MLPISEWNTRSGKFLPHLSAQVEEWSLRFIEADESKRAEAGDLTAELRSNRARSASHHHNFSLDALANAVLVQMHRPSAEYVFDSHIPDLLVQLRALNEVPQTRHHLVLRSGIEGQLQNAHHLRPGRGGNRDQHSLDGVRSHHLCEGFSSSEHRLPLQDHVSLQRIVIDEAHDLTLQRLVLAKLPQQCLPCYPGAVD